MMDLRHSFVLLGLLAGLLGDCRAGLPWKQSEVSGAESFTTAADGSKDTAFAAAVSALHGLYVRIWAGRGEVLEARLYQRQTTEDTTFSASLAVIGPYNSSLPAARDRLRPFGTDEIIEEQFDRPEEARGQSHKPRHLSGYKVWQPSPDPKAVADPFIPRADLELAKARFITEAEGWHYWVAADVAHTTRGCQVAASNAPEEQDTESCAAHVIIALGPEEQDWGLWELLGHPAFAEPLHRWEAVDGAVIILPAMTAAFLSATTMWCLSRRWSRGGEAYLEQVLVSDGLLASASAFYCGSAAHRLVLLLVFLHRGLFNFVDCMMVILVVLLILTFAAVAAGSWAHVRCNLSFTVQWRAALGSASFASLFCFGAGTFMGPILGLAAAALPEENLCSVLPYSNETLAAVRSGLRRALLFCCCAADNKEEEEHLSTSQVKALASPNAPPSNCHWETPPQVIPAPQVEPARQQEYGAGQPQAPDKSASGAVPRPPGDLQHSLSMRREESFSGLHPAPRDDPLRHLLNEWCDAFQPAHAELQPQPRLQPQQPQSQWQDGFCEDCERGGPASDAFRPARGLLSRGQLLHPFAPPLGSQTPGHSNPSTPTGAGVGLGHTSPQAISISEPWPRHQDSGSPIARVPVLPPLQLPASGLGTETLATSQTPPRSPFFTPHSHPQSHSLPTELLLPPHPGHAASAFQPALHLSCAEDAALATTLSQARAAGFACGSRAPLEIGHEGSPAFGPHPAALGMAAAAAAVPAVSTACASDHMLMAAAQLAAQVGPPPSLPAPTSDGGGLARIPASPLAMSPRFFSAEQENCILLQRQNSQGSDWATPRPQTPPHLLMNRQGSLSLKSDAAAVPRHQTPPPPAAAPGLARIPLATQPKESLVGHGKSEDPARDQQPGLEPRSHAPAPAPSPGPKTAQAPRKSELKTETRQSDEAEHEPEPGSRKQEEKSALKSAGMSGPDLWPPSPNPPRPAAETSKAPQQRGGREGEKEDQEEAEQPWQLQEAEETQELRPQPQVVQVQHPQPQWQPSAPSQPPVRLQRQEPKAATQKKSEEAEERLQQRPTGPQGKRAQLTAMAPPQPQPPQPQPQEDPPSRQGRSFNPLQPHHPLLPNSGLRPADGSSVPSTTPQRRVVLPPVEPGGSPQLALPKVTQALPPSMSTKEALPSPTPAPDAFSNRGASPSSTAPCEQDASTADLSTLRAQAMTRRLSRSPRNQLSDFTGADFPEMPALVRPSMPGQLPAGRRFEPRPPPGQPEVPTASGGAETWHSEASVPPPPLLRPSAPEPPISPAPTSARSERSRRPRTPPPTDQSCGLNLDFNARRA